jgi:cbb3-type cytochrome c oxidase subunit III
MVAMAARMKGVSHLKWVKRFRLAAVLATATAVPLILPASQAQVEASSSHPGAQSYAAHCAMCHGEQREGHPPAIPSLVDIQKKMTNDQIEHQIRAGGGAMPAFPNLAAAEMQALLLYLTGTPAGKTGMVAAAETSGSAEPPSDAVKAGDALFQQNCSFCHGRDAEGGESGPDLTQSKIVLTDTNGDKIAAVVRGGRPDNKMPAFTFSESQIQNLVAFLHARAAAANARQGGRRGVLPADLQTGNVEAGKAYFNGPGGCSRCHSPTGDLAGIATRYQGLQLEEQMLYPRHAKSTVTVTLPSGEKISGTLAYHDEFTVGLRDANGVYHSWQTSRVKYTIDAPVEAHVDQFSKYTDADIHNLMAYIQTLR